MDKFNKINNEELIKLIIPKLSDLKESQLKSIFNLITKHDIILNVDGLTFPVKYNKTNVEITDNGIQIGLLINQERMKLINICLARVRLSRFYNKSGKKGLGHKVLCQLLKKLVRHHIISREDDISWEVEPGSYKQMDGLVSYYERIGGRVLNRDYEGDKKKKFNIYMGSSVDEMIDHCP
jgi:hypothetical protein